MEEAACQMEHVVKKEIEEEIVGYSGSETCPHGKRFQPVPVVKSALSGDKFVAPLASLKRGEKGVIAYIKLETRKNSRSLWPWAYCQATPLP